MYSLECYAMKNEATLQEQQDNAIAALERLEIPLRRREEPVPFVAKLS